MARKRFDTQKTHFDFDGKQLKEIRLIHKLSQRDFGKILIGNNWHNRTMISKWENNRVFVPKKYHRKYLALYNRLDLNSKLLVCMQRPNLECN